MPAPVRLLLPLLLLAVAGCTQCGSIEACDHMQASVDTLQQKLTPCGENAGISLVNFDHCADALGSTACTPADVSYFNATSTCFDAVKDCVPNQEDAWQAAVNACQTHLAPVSKACRAALDPSSSGS